MEARQRFCHETFEKVHAAALRKPISFWTEKAYLGAERGRHSFSEDVDACSHACACIVAECELLVSSALGLLYEASEGLCLSQMSG